MTNRQETCPHCGRPLDQVGGIPLCLHCNDHRGQYYGLLSESISAFAEQTDKVMIECPGATLYLPDGNEVVAGVRFIDQNDPARGYEIVNHPVYGPKHVLRRWVKREDAHLIRRCESCQDYTIRMRRKEGPNLYIPSRKHPDQRRRPRMATTV
jgi:rRNA maturation protein Nop10